MLKNNHLITVNIINNFDKYTDNTCIIAGIFEDDYLLPTTIEINKISQGYILSLLNRIKFTGIIGKTLLLYDVPYFFNKKILLIGCGTQNKLNPKSFEKIINTIISSCKKESIYKISLLLNELNIQEYDNYWKIRRIISLFNKELYIFNKFKSNKNIRNNVTYEINIYIPNINEIQYSHQAIKESLSIANGVNFSKNLSNSPPNYCTPNYLVDITKDLSKRFKTLEIEILNEYEIKNIGMNAYLSVSQGSNYPAVMPIIKYYKHPKGPNFNPIVFIGKGLTFDSGGLSIKPANKMDEMKYDMCGASVVCAIMYIAAELNLPLNIIGILAISENMISEKSLRPGDIITTLSGKTVEIINTDAEGRLVLCDALTYAKKYSPTIIIDIATLTGACVVALGHHYSGIMSNNDKLAEDLMLAANQSEDYIWRLPLDTVFEKQLKSNHADISNVGNGAGSVITAACFLQKFVEKYHWAHLDIAGTAWKSRNWDKSSTGRPVELLSQFLINKKNEYNTS